MIAYRSEVRVLKMIDEAILGECCRSRTSKDAIKGLCLRDRVGGSVKADHVSI